MRRMLSSRSRRKAAPHVALAAGACLAVACAGERPAVAPSAESAGAPAGVTTLTAASACPASPTAGRYHDLAAILEPIRQKHNLPALGAAIITPDGVESIGVVGLRRWGSTAPACVDDTFHLGSDTKAMTATVVAKLVELNKLSWNTTLGAVFNDLSINPGWASVTLEQLLAHRAGLPHDAGKSGFGRNLVGTIRQQREEYVRVALSTPPTADLGHYHYSNTGYIIAGVMAERASGSSWEDLMRLYVYQPLGMAHAGFGLNAPLGTVDGLVGHHIDANGTPVPLDAATTFPVAGPAGTAHASMEDWGKFIADMLRGFDGRGALLSAATYQYIHTPKLGGTYAYGWGVKNTPWAGGNGYFHEGTNTSNLAMAWVFPTKKAGFLVATNVGPKAVPACNEAKNALIQSKFGAVGPAEVDHIDGENQQE